MMLEYFLILVPIPRNSSSRFKYIWVCSSSDQQKLFVHLTGPCLQLVHSRMERKLKTMLLMSRNQMINGWVPR